MNRILQPFAVLQAHAMPYLLGTFAILVVCAWALVTADPGGSGQGVPQALQGGALCGLATALGATPVLLIRRLPQSIGDGLLGFGAGVMLAATAFSLVLPGLEAAGEAGHSKWSAGALVSAGVILGAIALLMIGRAVGDEPLEIPRGGVPLLPSRVLVFVLAIMLHNVPEGMAVGVAAAGGLGSAESLAMGIALQDVPEGMVVALILAAAGMARAKAVFLGAVSGVIEPVAAVASAWMLGVSSPLLPWGLAFAGGAMLMAVGNSVIPESNRHGNGAIASVGLVIGFCVMMVLDTALG
jgi:ZIP family zinc transporter